MKRRTIIKSYTILMIITIILIICHIIFISDYHIRKKIVNMLHQKRNENNNIDIARENSTKNYSNIESTTNSKILNKKPVIVNKIPNEEPEIVNKTSGYLLNNDQILNHIVKKRHKRDNPNNDLKELLNCKNRDFNSQVIQYGEFWVLKNYIRAGHGEIPCHETITYTTHAHFTYLEHLVPLLKRWRAPISIAIYTPNIDVKITIDSISYLRNCLHDSNLIRQFVTFHLYFNEKYVPVNIPKVDTINYVFCPPMPPYILLENARKSTSTVRYPVNAGRNIAREAAQTYFILDSEIDLVPTPDLPTTFLTMILSNSQTINLQQGVFSLPVFKIKAKELPKTKIELQSLIFQHKADPFYERVCPNCMEQMYANWMQKYETNDLEKFNIPKFNAGYASWRPFYIGTNTEPLFDNRLSWEGGTERILQSYLLCLLQYEYYVINNAFLMHKVDTKHIGIPDKYSEMKSKEFVNSTILKGLTSVYGTHENCKLF